MGPDIIGRSLLHLAAEYSYNILCCFFMTFFIVLLLQRRHHNQLICLVPTLKDLFSLESSVFQGFTFNMKQICLKSVDRQSSICNLVMRNHYAIQPIFAILNDFLEYFYIISISHFQDEIAMEIQSKKYQGLYI